MCVNGRRCWSTVRGPGPCRRLFRGLRRSVEYAVVVLGVPATARWSRPRSTGWSTSSTASTRSTSSSRRASRVRKSSMAADERLSDTEALMWSIERDPVLRATFLTVSFLDRPPDVAHFRRRMAHVAARIPRLRQRIDGRQWVDDPDFDLDYHVRHIALPPPGTERHLLDDAARDYEHAFDPARPLWQLTMVDRLEGDRAAMLASMHHTITDSVGDVRMSAMFLDVERHAPDAPTLDPGPPKETAASSVVESVRRAVGEVVDTVRDPVGTVRSIGNQLGVVDDTRPPLWQGPR